MATNNAIIAKIGEVGESIRRIDISITEIKNQLSTSSTDINKLKNEVDLIKRDQEASQIILDKLAKDMTEIRSDRDKVLGGFFTISIVGAILGSIAAFFKPLMQYVTYFLTKNPTN